jgi:uncharacterized protein (DUF362 family)
MNTSHTTRRDFLKRSVVSSLGLAAGLRTFSFGSTANAANAILTTRSQVAVTHGSDHVDNIFRAMEALKAQIAAKIGNRPVLIKTNHVSGGQTPLAETPCECVEGILEFLKSIGKTDVTVVECPITNPALKCFQSMGYFNLLNKYPVRFRALADEGFQWQNVYYQSALTNRVRMSKVLMNPNYFVISACRPKAHDRVVATLSLKNIVMGSVMVDASTFYGGSGASDKPSMHNSNNTTPYGDGNSKDVTYYKHQDLNNTICMMSRMLAPDMSVIDTWQGMQGSGPISGTPVTPQQAAIASLDFLSADRIATILMDVHNSILNINTTLRASGYTPDGDVADNSVPGGSAATITYNWPKYPACLNYCGQNGLGQYDSNLIDLVGDVTGPASTGNISNTAGTLVINSGLTPLVTTYTLHPNTVSGQSLWMRPTPFSTPIGTDRRPT